MALGAGAFIVPHIGWLAGVGLCLVGVVAVVSARYWTPMRELVQRDSGELGFRGLILYPLVVISLLLIFRDNLIPTQAGWLALAVGDGLAPILGPYLTQPRWPWNRLKSVAASSVSFICAGLLMLLVMPVSIALGAATAGCLAESLPGVEDNLSIPAAAAATAALMQGGAMPW